MCFNLGRIPPEDRSSRRGGARPPVERRGQREEMRIECAPGMGAAIGGSEGKATRLQPRLNLSSPARSPRAFGKKGLSVAAGALKVHARREPDLGAPRMSALIRDEPQIAAGLDLAPHTNTNISAKGAGMAPSRPRKQQQTFWQQAVIFVWCLPGPPFFLFVGGGRDRLQSCPCRHNGRSSKRR